MQKPGGRYAGDTEVRGTHLCLKQRHKVIRVLLLNTVTCTTCFIAIDYLFTSCVSLDLPVSVINECIYNMPGGQQTHLANSVLAGS